MFARLLRLWKSLTRVFQSLVASLAIYLIRRKLRRRPHDVNLLLPLARLYELRCQWPQALEAVDRTHQLQPHTQAIMQLRARIQEAAAREQAEKAE